MEYQNNYNGDDNNNNQGYYREGGGESDNRGSYSDNNNNGYNNYYNGYNNNYNNYENDSGYSVAALVLGILSIILCCCYGIVGITLGILGLVFALKYKNPTTENECSCNNRSYMFNYRTYSVNNYVDIHYLCPYQLQRN